jgi:hypothetical protein
MKLTQSNKKGGTTLKGILPKGAEAASRIMERKGY